MVSVLKRYHEVSEDWKGKKDAGLDLKWNYAKVCKDRTCCLSVKGYIAELLLPLGHAKPSKPQMSPHKSKDITYGSKVQLSPDVDISSELKKDGITGVQMIVGTLLWIGQAVNNKVPVALSAIGSRQTAAIEDTMAAVNQLLDCCATYPEDGITYRASNIVLAVH